MSVDDRHPPETPGPRERGPGRVSRVAVAVGALVVLVFAAVAVAAVLTSDDNGRTYSYAIPSGAAEMDESQQQALGGPPSQLDLAVGDTLEVRNDDSITHTYGFLVLAPGEIGRYTFTTQGRFTGDCTFVAHETVTITVDG